MTRTFGSVLLSVVLAVGAVAPVVASTTITVTTTTDELIDNGNCSIREAIRAANLDSPTDACPAGTGADTIVVPAGTYALSLGGRNDDAGLSGDLDITGDLTIEGAGPSRSILVGNGDRVLDILGRATAQISGLTITGGFLPFGEGAGVRNAGSLTLTDTNVSGNVVSLPDPSSPCSDSYPDCPREIRGGGAGIRSSGALALFNSTVSDNHLELLETPEAGFGAAILGGDVTLTNSTVSGNSGFFGALAGSSIVLISSTVTDNLGDSFGGVAPAGHLIVRNSILAGNRTLRGSPEDCSPSNSGVSQGHNILGDCSVTGDLTGNISTFDPDSGRVTVDLKLGPLQDNSGPTHTHALLPTSPAIDAGNPSAINSGGFTCPDTDQRGITRPLDGNLDGRAVCDIGAFELKRSSTQPPNAVPPARPPTRRARPQPRLSRIAFGRSVCLPVATDSSSGLTQAVPDAQ